MKMDKQTYLFHGNNIGCIVEKMYIDQVKYTKKMENEGYIAYCLNNFTLSSFKTLAVTSKGGSISSLEIRCLAQLR